MVNTTINALKLPPNRSSNVYIGAQVVAYAREIMYKHLLTLQEIPDCKIYQIECDSLFFSLPITFPCPLSMSPFLGDFKNAYGNKEIVSFYSLGQKQYCLNFFEDSSVSKIQSIFKISGLSLQNEFNEKILDQNTFEKFLDSFCEGENSSKTSDFVNLKVITYQQKYTLTNQLSHKRFVNVFDANFTTYPFGYNFD